MSLALAVLVSFLALEKTPRALAVQSVGPLDSVNAIIKALDDPSVDRVFLGRGLFALNGLSALAGGGGLVIGPNRQVELVGNADLLDIANAWEPHRPGHVLQYASGLDFGSTSQGLFRLGDNTTLGFRNLFLLNGLSQLGYDWQVVSLLQPGARAVVRFTQTVKLREGCLPLQIFQQHVTSYTRLPDKAGQQAASLQPFCFVPPPGAPNTTSWGASANSTMTGNITCVAETLAILDLATSITRSNGQSYNLYEQNSSYWCRAYASMSCLSASGPEQCVRELLSSNSSTKDSGAGSSLPPNATASGAPEDEGNDITNIVLPAVITGALTLAFVTATVWCLHRRGAARRGSSLAALAGAGPAQAGDVEAGGGGEAAAAAAAGGGRGVGVGTPVGDALARLLPGAATREAQQRRKPHVPGYVPTVSKEALDRIAKVRAELSSKMVVASSADDLSDVRNLCLVGKGTFGRVYKGEWKGVTVALKVISVPVSQCGQAQWQQVLSEAAIATLLNHPCVLQTYSVALLEYCPAAKPASAASDEEAAAHGASSVKGGNSDGQPAPPPPPPPPTSGATLDGMVPFYQLKMVSEFCEGGSVVQALRRMQFYDFVGGGTVRMPALLDIASQVACGMAYLHSANIVHADLKAANVLLKQQPGSGRLQAKVGDFGLSFRLEDPEATHATKGQLGSITHMAPEVLMYGRVSKASDVYSFGILLYELYTGQQAYWDVPQPLLAHHVATSGGRPLLPPHCPAVYRGLAKACWASEPAVRPNFEEVYRRLQDIAEALQEPNRSRTQTAPNAAAAATTSAATDARAPQRQQQQQQQMSPQQQQSASRHEEGGPAEDDLGADGSDEAVAGGQYDMVPSTGAESCGGGLATPPPSLATAAPRNEGAEGPSGCSPPPPSPPPA